MNIIETKGLSRSFGNRVAVADLNLTIPAGTVFGFLGPNGAGKTTTARLLTALIAPTGGEARIAGLRLGRENQAIRRSVGLLTESPGLYDRLSAWHNLLFFARLYDLSAAQAAAQAESYLRMLGLWERRAEPVGRFSKGMRQKLAIARALMHEPVLVFLDEPTAGLDPAAARMVRDFIKELRQSGRSIFLTTHNLVEAQELCDQIGIFQTRMITVGTPHELRAKLGQATCRVRLATEAAAWVSRVDNLPFVQQVRAEGDTLTVGLFNPDNDNPLLVEALVQAGARIRYVEEAGQSLEEVYLQMLGQTAETGLIPQKLAPPTKQLASVTGKEEE